MRRSPSLLLVLALGSLGCASASVQQPAVTGAATGVLTPGSRVVARHHRELLLAEMLSYDGDWYVVKLSSGGKARVTKDDIVPIAAVGTLKAGDRVLAPAAGARMWQADVVRVEGTDAVVVLSGQPGEVRVPQDRVAALPTGFCDAHAGCADAGPTRKDTGAGLGTRNLPSGDPLLVFRDDLKIGDRVLVQWAVFPKSNHHEWRPGTVAGRNGDSIVVKVDHEATTRSATAGELRPLRLPRRPIGRATNLLWSDQPGRYVEIWVAMGANQQGKLLVHVKRGELGDTSPVEMTEDQLTQIAPLDAEDF